VGYRVSKPSSILSPYVKHYWAIDRYLLSVGGHVQRVVPNGLTELMFYLGDRPTALDDKRHILGNTILSGQQKGYYDILVSGKLSLFSISFQPFGARMFFDIPSSELFDRNVPLKYLLKDRVDELESSLYASDTFEEKISIVEEFLINLLRGCSKEYEVNRIAKSVGLVNQWMGVVDINLLASSACLSRKQYERTFSDYIGTSLKQFLRTVRFQRTLQVKQLNSSIPFTELACTCGYYDQSHMIGDFRLLSGKTPSQYFSECEPYSDYFSVE